MKLMYSIIIVLVAAALVFFALKKAEKPVDSSVTGTGTQLQTTNTMNTTQEPTAMPASDQLLMTTVKEGTGTEAKEGDTVSVHYSGYLSDGTKFDSSLDRGTPFEFTLGENRVIKGWELGVKGMKAGEVRKLIIPSEFGYGEAGFPGVIPGNATLAFEVELLEIKAK